MAITFTALCLFSDHVEAWHDEGHYYAAIAGTIYLPDEVPAFFKQGYKTIGHTSIDPDLIKHRKLSQLNNTEWAEHFFDSEIIGNRKLPTTRYEFYKLCEELGIEPRVAGTLPYAVTEWTQRLTMAFAEHRAYPDNIHIQAKCLIYAGILAHYTADLNMPLHTTIDYDGINNKDGKPKLHKGIHAKIDSLPSKLPYNIIFEEPLQPLAAHTDIFTFTQKQFASSYNKIKQAYALAEQYPATRDLTLQDAEVIAFTKDRTRAAAWFTGSIYLSAWKNSAGIDLPSWLDRDVFDESFNPNTVPDIEKAKQ
ncbi:hypothetical protein [Poriferisphaera sp. WC338]|uniref:hypothetical protein n=1 Tax=Poriferisphaera sp. WC338 TaxID=3425129 RepID=UPI003D813274